MARQEQRSRAYRQRTTKVSTTYKKELDDSTKFIPIWVTICVALALGLGTMIGWKRIVVTVGEKIGKEHLTYGQGAAAELVAAGTIGTADFRPAGFDNPRPVFGCRRHDGRQWFGPAIGDLAQYCDGLGADPAVRDRTFGFPLLDLRAHLLIGRKNLLS